MSTNLVITSADSKISIETEPKTKAQSILTNVVKSDKTLSKDIKINAVNVTNLPSKLLEYKGEATITLSFNDTTVKLPADVMVADSTFNWKSTNNFFEWNNVDVTNDITTLLEVTNNLFDNLSIGQDHSILGITNYLNTTAGAKWWKTKISSLMNVLKTHNKPFVYDSSYSFLSDNLVFSKVSNVTAPDPTGHNGTLSITFTKSATDTDHSDNLTLPTINGVPYSIM